MTMISCISQLKPDILILLSLFKPAFQTTDSSNYRSGQVKRLPEL